MTAMPTIRDVARLAGVSTSTVSLALGSGNRVSPETAGRVWAAAEQLGYQPNPLAQSLKRGHARMIGVIVGDISNPFFGRLLKGVERRALEAGFHVVVSDSDANATRELAVLQKLAAQRIGGIVLTPHGGGEDYAARLHGLQTPIVTVDHRVPGGRFDYVASDGCLAAAMLTEHLLNLGHRRLAQIAGRPDLWTAVERKRGFRMTLQAAGVEPDESLIVDGNYVDSVAYEQTMRLMTRPDRPTAILAANNMMALGALQAIQELGFSCPRDVSLAAIDDVPWSAVIRPTLTMVVQDVDRLARAATDFLLERMEDRGRQEVAPRDLILIPRLVLGTSTSQPPR
jgi:LacI family transcriptional regulator